MWSSIHLQDWLLAAGGVNVACCQAIILTYDIVAPVDSVTISLLYLLASRRSITASFGHSSSTVNSTFHVFLFFPWEFSFLLHPSFLAGLFTRDRNTRSHSNSAECLAEVPNQAFCDVTFLSYLAGHENGKLGSHFKINTPCSQPLSQEYEM